MHRFSESNQQTYYVLVLRFTYFYIGTSSISLIKEPYACKSKLPNCTYIVVPYQSVGLFLNRVGVINNDCLFHNIYDHESHILVFNLYTSTIPPNRILLLPDSLWYIVLFTLTVRKYTCLSTYSVDIIISVYKNRVNTLADQGEGVCGLHPTPLLFKKGDNKSQEKQKKISKYIHIQ